MEPSSDEFIYKQAHLQADKFFFDERGLPKPEFRLVESFIGGATDRDEPTSMDHFKKCLLDEPYSWKREIIPQGQALLARTDFPWEYFWLRLNDTNVEPSEKAVRKWTEEALMLIDTLIPKEDTDASFSS